jgi:hypothetical protein
MECVSFTFPAPGERHSLAGSKNLEQRPFHEFVSFSTDGNQMPVSADV